jgi:hypothetical protein
LTKHSNLMKMTGSWSEAFSKTQSNLPIQVTSLFLLFWLKNLVQQTFLQ